MPHRRRHDSRGYAELSSIVLIAIGIIAIAIVVITLAAFHERSTAGVTEIGDRIVSLPSGEELVLSYSSGKSSTTLKVTYDGDLTLTVKREGIFGETKNYRLNEIGIETGIEVVWLRSFTATAQADGTADISWPWGWTYWRHQS